DGRARPHPADHAQPRGDGLAQQRIAAGKRRLLLQRNPDVGRIALQCFAEESRRSDSDQGKGMAFNDECGTYNRGVRSIDGLPGLMTENGDRRRGRLIVGGSHQASAEGAYAQDREEISRDVLGGQRPGGSLHALPANADAPTPGLKSSRFFEFGSLRLEQLVQRKGVHAPAILRTALHAAVIAIAHTVQAAGIRHRQRAQHHGIDQGKDRGGAANSQSQGEYRRNREDRGHSQLPQGIAKIAEQIFHVTHTLDWRNGVWFPLQWMDTWESLWRFQEKERGRESQFGGGQGKYPRTTICLFCDTAGSWCLDTCSGESRTHPSHSAVAQACENCLYNQKLVIPNSVNSGALSSAPE